MPLLILVGLLTWVISGWLTIQEQAHYEHNYSTEQVKAMEHLVNEAASGEPDAQPVVLMRNQPVYSEAERARLIAKVWNLQDGNYKIGALK